MSDFEMLSIVLMIISLVVALLHSEKKKKADPSSSANCDGGSPLTQEGRSQSKSVIPSCRYCITWNTGVSTGLP